MSSRKGFELVVGKSRDLPEGGSLSFSFKDGDFPQFGFVIRQNGGLKAYLNRCPHAGTPLDFGDNEFFTDDKAFLLCRTHGALFNPPDGFCVAGPCSGQFLQSFQVVESGDVVKVTLPRS